MTRFALRRNETPRLLGLLLFSLAATAGCRSTADVTAIERTLQKQVDDWNRGDLDAFMGGYVRSDHLTFSSGGITRRGWQATIDRYRRQYPDRAAMGRLRFTILESTILAPGVALVLGDWQLVRATDELRGNFSLVLQKSAGGWRIRHDHTSRRPAE